MSSARLALWAAAATGVQVGLATVASRYVITQTTPLSLAFLRYLLGFALLLPGLLLVRRVRLANRDWLPVCVLGVGQFAILILLLNIGLKTVNAAQAAMLFSTMPLATWLLSALIDRHPPSVRRGLAILVCLAGVALAMSDKWRAGAPVSVTHWWGELAVLASALVGAICSIGYRPYLRRYPALQVGTIAMFASALVLGLAAAAEGSLAGLGNIDRGGWAAIVFVGASSAVGYFLWLWALNHESATRVTAFLSLSPICATLAGGWLLLEPFTALVLVGLAMTVVGLVMAART